MYENEYTMFFIIWIVAIFGYLEWCRRNQDRWFINPVDATMYWFGIGFGVTAIYTYANGNAIATIGNAGLAVMFFVVIPIMLEIFSRSSVTSTNSLAIWGFK